MPVDSARSGGDACESIQNCLDSYIDNEFPAEDRARILRHLENCPACSNQFELRRRLRGRLKAAIGAQAVPQGLKSRIREAVERKPVCNWLPGWLEPAWPRWAAASAVGLALGAGLWLNHSNPKLPALSDRAGQLIYIQKVSASLATVLKVGLGDHIHCAVFRRYPKSPPPVERLQASLGAAYQGLMPVLSEAAPRGYRLVMAHHCGFDGRRLIHLTYEKDGALMSVVVSRRTPGETITGLRAVARSGVPIYQSSAGPYRVAAFEAGDFLVYVVSELAGDMNLQVARNAAPGVREFLSKRQA